MPRYLGIDYLADALQQKRNMRSQMLLTIPSHLEYVEAYSHNGKVGKNIGRIPWKRESAFKLSSKQPVDYLSQLTGSCPVQLPEPYSPQTGTVEDIVPSSNPDSPLVSFDVWSDLEEEVANYVVSALAPDKEEFKAMNKNLNDGAMKDKLEEMESIDYFHETLQRIPRVKALCSRLKTKPVEDPLSLDRKGNPLQEKNLLRMEFKVNILEECEKKPTNTDKEIFLKILNNDTANEGDFTLQNEEIEDIVSPVILSVQPACTVKAQQSLGLVKETQSEVEKSELLSVGPFAFEDTEPFLDKTATDSTKTTMKNNDFVTLNSEDDPKPEDFLKDQQLLESPSHLPTLLVTDENSRKFINALEKFKLPTEIESPPMTPTKVSQCVQSIWENEKILFNEHLAMVFPVPSTSQERRKGHTMTLVQVALKKLTLSQECLSGQLELGLPWDPLAQSVNAIETCRRNLQRLSAWSDKGDKAEHVDIRTRALSHSGETFCKKNLQVLELPSNERLPEKSMEESSCKIQAGRHPGHELVPTAATIENQSTLHTSKGPARKVQRSTITKSVATKSSITAKEENISFVVPSTTSDVLRQKQTSSGLEDFLLLRKGKHDTLKPPSHRQCTPPKTVVKAAKVRPSVFTKDTSESDQRAPKEPAEETKGSGCQVQQQNITVGLSDEFQDVLNELIAQMRPLLSRLQDNGVIPQSKTLSTLNPEYTRFVLKQAEMSVRKTEENNLETQIFCMTVCLHALVSSVDILMQSGLEAAIAYLSSTQEKYGGSLRGALESTRRYLFETHFTFRQRKVLHPKLLKLLCLVAQWSKEGNASHLTAAIFTYAFPQNLNNEIIETLSGVNGVQARLYTSATEINEVACDKNLVIYVVSALSVTEDFPWGSFDFVLDYDLNAVMRREGLSRSRRLKAHINLRTKAETQLDQNRALEVQGSGPQFKEIQVDDQFIFIGSDKITLHVDLLQLLETKHNVLIYERQYSNPRPRDPLTKMCLQPDIMIDERTCIHLQHLPCLADEDKYEGLRDTVLSLSLKCNKCCVILYSSNEQEYAFTGDVLRHLSTLFASIAHFQKSDFEVEIIYSFTVEETANLIRQIGEVSRAQSAVWKKQEWIKRKWLTNEASAHEKFLLSLPCMNSFSAQVMLTAAPLATLLKMTLIELKETCPWIPQRILTEFHRTINWCSELNDYHTAYPCVRPVQKIFQQCKQISESRYNEHIDEASPFHMATPPFNSSPDSVVTNTSDSTTTWMDNIEHNGDLLQEIIRNADSDKSYYNWSYKGDKPTTIAVPDTSVTVDRPNIYVSQKDCIGAHHRQNGDYSVDQSSVDNGWKSLMDKNSSASLEDRVALDLKRCISGVKLPDNRYEFNPHPHLNPDQHLLTKDPAGPHSREGFAAKVRWRPENFSQSQSRTADKSYVLSTGRESDFTDLGFPGKANSSIFHTAVDNTGRPPLRDAEQQYRVEPHSGIGRVHQRQQKPDCYSRTDSNAPQAHLKSSMGRDLSGNRTRHPVRVLNLGDENFHVPPTKVGIAQPQRRTYCLAGQVLGENSVASQHKRFSLGIEKSTGANTESISQRAYKGEREIPRKQQSQEDLDDWSLFSSYLPAKRRKLTYERIPGVPSGQTKLVFKNDL